MVLGDLRMQSPKLFSSDLTRWLPLPDALWTHELEAGHVVLCRPVPEVQQPLLLEIIGGHHQLADLLVGDGVLITVVICPLHALKIHLSITRRPIKGQNSGYMICLDQ